MSEHLSSKELEPAARRYWRAADLVFELRQHNASQEARAELDYIEWIQDVVRKGVGGDILLSSARELSRFDVGYEDFGSDIAKKITPQLTAIAQQLRETYEKGALATVEELNAFISIHPELLRVGSEDGAILDSLKTEWDDRGILSVSPYDKVLYVDTFELGDEHREMLPIK